MDILTKDETVHFPRTCVFTGDGEGPFVDTNTWLNARELDGVDPYGYVSVGFAKNLGRAIGMVPAEDVEVLRERVDALEAGYAALDAYREAVEDMAELELPDWVTTYE